MVNYSGTVASLLSRQPQVGDLTQFHPEGDGTHLGLRGASFVPDEQQVALTVDHDLLLEATACGGKQSGARQRHDNGARRSD